MKSVGRIKKRPAQNSALGDYPLVSEREGCPGLTTKSGCLVILGSAGVFMVYAAGFVRTARAAHRFHLIAVAARVAASGIRHYKDGTYTGWGSWHIPALR